MLLALIMLTQLDGNPIWVESSAVLIVKPTPHATKNVTCQPPAGAAVRIDGVGLCVRETPEQIRGKLDEVKR